MKGTIYAIRSHQTKDVYIGSTTQKYLCKRLAEHRKDYKNWVNGSLRYITSSEILKYDDAYIELIEIVEFNERTELLAREGHYIRTMECINKSIAGRTNKEWRTENKDKLKEYDKQYRNNNKEILKQRRLLKQII